MATTLRIVIIQNGDYGDAYRRLRAGGPETFRDQRHSVDYVAALVPDHEITTIAVCDRHHDEELAPGLRSIGIPPDLAWDRRRLWPLLDRLAPEALVCRSPFRVALAWAAANRVPTLPVFADTFTSEGWRDRLRNWRDRRVIRRCRKPCVANHSLSASESLQYLGFAPDHIVPWEFRRLEPIGEAKEAPPPDRPFRLFFAGSLIESKGVGDSIEAVAIARAAHGRVELTIVGPGETDRWAALARQHGIEASVRLQGVIPAGRVIAEMRDHDAVLVPSRHDYAEGLPNTLYEALASRSPLLASDHPGFARRLRPSVDSLVFRAGRPRELAEQIERLIREPGLYARLSRASAGALASLYVGIEWSELVTRFIGDPLGTGGWTEGLTLAAHYRRSPEAGPVV
jgi:glycosyltransferase involved in cell wall biosynthesis